MRLTKTMQFLGMVMLDKETRARIADYFSAPELAEYLQLDVNDLIEDHSGEIEDVLDDIEELMGLRREND